MTAIRKVSGMEMTTTQKQFLWFFGILIFLSIVIYALKRFFFSKKQVEEKLLPNNCLLINLDEEIAEISDSKKEAIELLHNQLFEEKNWDKSIPKLSFNGDWEVQPEPASRDSIVQFKVWNQTRKAPVSVTLNKKSEDWTISASSLKEISIPLHDTIQLRAVIASYLQQVSPIIPTEN